MWLILCPESISGGSLFYVRPHLMMMTMMSQHEPCHPGSMSILVISLTHRSLVFPSPWKQRQDNRRSVDGTVGQELEGEEGGPGEGPEDHLRGQVHHPEHRFSARIHQAEVERLQQDSRSVLSYQFLSML